MATPAYIPIATTTLASSTSTISFAGIPADYRDLRLVISAKAVEANGTIFMRLNGDSAANYNHVQMAGNGSATHSEANSGFSSFRLGYNYNLITNTHFNSSTVDLLDYSVTDKHKSILIRTNESSLATFAVAGRYASTTAVSGILLYPGGFTNFAAGSTFSLFGILGEEA